MNKDNNKQLWHSILLYSLVAVYALLLFALLFGKDSSMSHVNLRPFFTLRLYLFRHAPLPVSNLVGNILLFVPLGVYLSLFCRNKNILLLLLWVLLFSVTVEAAQYVFKAGSTDIDDVMLNVLGGFLGIMLYRLLHRFFKDRVRYAVEYSALIVGALFLLLIFLLSSGVLGFRILVF